MKNAQPASLQPSVFSLQTSQVCCKLQTICKLKSSKNSNLKKFVVCRYPLQTKYKSSIHGACSPFFSLHANPYPLQG